MKLVAASVILACAASSVATADPEPVVAPSAPFTADQLADALALRLAGHPGTIRVSTGAAGVLVVEVDGEERTIEALPTAGPAAARIVAMVVVTLVDRTDRRPAVEPAPVEVPAPPAPPIRDGEQPLGLGVSHHAGYQTPPSRLSLQLLPSVLKDDAGDVGKVMSLSVGYRVAAHTRVVGTAGLGRFDDNLAGNLFAPLRLGVEQSYGVVGVEAGATAIPYAGSCGDGAGAATGAYGALRLALPVGATGSLVVEGGAYYLGDRSFTPMCHGPMEYQSYAGWFGAGGAWSL